MSDVEPGGDGLAIRHVSERAADAAADVKDALDAGWPP
jgi:hypothetical protein